MLTMDEIYVVERLQLDGFEVTANDILVASRQVHMSIDAPNSLEDDEDGDGLREALAETSRRWAERLELIVRRAHVD